MSAMPAPTNVVDFKLPKKKPKVIEKEAPPDQRTYAVVPLRALRDKKLTSGDIRVLGIMASYANRAGLTWVGQKRMGEDLQVSQQAISKHLKRLTAMGYIEVVSQGFRGEKACTRRIIFDASMTAQDAIAVTSSQEDTRPPQQIKREQELMRVMSDNELPDLSPEQIKANMKRLEALLGTLGRPSNFRTHQPTTLGAIMAETKPTRKRAAKTPQPAVVETPKDNQKDSPIAQPKVVQERSKKSVHTQPLGCESEGLHTQPDTQPQGCANTEKQVSSRYLDVLKQKGFRCLNNENEVELLSECMTVEQAREALEVVAGRYQAEGLPLPTNLLMVIEDMISTHAARHLEASQKLS